MFTAQKSLITKMFSKLLIFALFFYFYPIESLPPVGLGYKHDLYESHFDLTPIIAVICFFGGTLLFFCGAIGFIQCAHLLVAKRANCVTYYVQDNPGNVSAIPMILPERKMDWTPAQLYPPALEQGVAEKNDANPKWLYPIYDV